MKSQVIILLGLLFFTACTPASPGLYEPSATVVNPNETPETSADNTNLLPEANERSEKPAISFDGQLVAYVSKASNLVGSDTNFNCGPTSTENCPDIFLHNRQTSVISLISVSSAAVQGNNFSDSPAISDDGRFVAFVSAATNLVPNDTNGQLDVFLRDIQGGQTKRVSISSAGGQSNGASLAPSISNDGRYIAFTSTASNLTANDNNSVQDIFVHDTATGVTNRVSISSAGQEANYWSLQPSVSADGRFVAFVSHATNLVTGDSNNTGDVFVHDRQTGATGRISVASNGTQANHISWAPDVSADGRYVVFSSNADNLASSDINQWGDIFLRDRVNNTTELISATTNRGPANSWSQFPVISNDGSSIAFFSWASNLTANDINNWPDIFLYQRATTQFSLVSVAGNGTQQLIGVTDMLAEISGNGRYIAFATPLDNLVPSDTNGQQDVFVYDKQTSAIIRVSGN
jgi:Tol biopolymer transport system component